MAEDMQITKKRYSKFNIIIAHTEYKQSSST